MLDEIDKTSGDDRYRASSALLDLLESRTAQRFVDQALDIEMDASMLWKIATANTLDTISKPVLSRLHVIEIAPPSDAQLRLIYLAQWRELVADLGRPPELSRAVERELIAHRQPPRVTHRLLRIGLGRALHERRHRVVDLPSKPQVKRHPARSALCTASDRHDYAHPLVQRGAHRIVLGERRRSPAPW